ncbi:MAG: bifunctional rhamnulose-1-phosphate aldolase/short-chain dehydrogenase [candidate division KSB1 bacterium]|nr:bifunctional rhamnulose-1-phosphate aldolase/short-chain dehydrogenase [candidate division KSB1 bacterium]MDZ7276239.1 bifunctional rhamnulose-1-phosphate aldolase/short-chain dehydrogenase [candidate division KSB1 bacterium]MDZ7287955.1 bifunctional rhamnulose-1-phosphate aldolase/short-chain dehydrogenase [candidate division KSB1 bacterium]MDZ7300032.1 bifunctional rhamnulose-1-phosphate aldolase/short-chain dehydrogenase [candidate division KSB1 bacterium]MDZ7308422.1 bifunctional rhamnul
MNSMKISRLENRWDDQACRGLSEAQLLLYRSNLLGSDLRITNYGGGNTSAKIFMPDPLTRQQVEVLWVKGSGGDLGSMKLDGFATLYLDKLRALPALYRGPAFEDEMVAYLPHCTFNLNPRAASIDTPLHAFIPHPHVDHTHPDAIIAIAAARDGERLTAEIFEGELGWLPWQRPGFDLGLKLQALCQARPHLKGVILGGHGLFTWGQTSKACYEQTLRVIQTASDYLASHRRGEIFGGQKYAALTETQRRDFAITLLPVLRGKVSPALRKIGHFSQAPEVLEFVNSHRAAELAAIGTSCPDHFLRTKIRPLLLDCDPGRESAASLLPRLDALLEQYRAEYQAYYTRCRRPDSPAMRDPNPVVILVPGVGMLTFAADKATARIAGEFYVNAINVMRGATSVSEYVGIPEQEAFNIEYWLLEEAKLQRLPKPRSLAGRVALITGAAGGIGMATARRFLQEGACVVLTDLDAGALEQACQELQNAFGKDNVRAVVTDVTNEAAVIASFRQATLEYGGLDILVSNAGLASASPLEETSLELWDKNMSVLATGYFLVAREACRLMKQQGLGGAIVFVGSKNALAASPKAAAYNTAKAAELHLARCLALEGAEFGIRANVVNPDAVLRGSKIWTGQWRRQRAEAYQIKEEQLEEFYRQRSLLKRSVFPEDVAEAIYFFASELSAKSTGNVLNVDAGHAAAFTR